MGAKCGKPENSKEERLRREQFLKQSETSTRILDRYASLTRTSSPHRPHSSVSNTLSRNAQLYTPTTPPPPLRRTQSNDPLLTSTTPEPYEFKSSNSSVYPLKIENLRSSDKQKGFSEILLSSNPSGWSPALEETERQRLGGGSSGFFGSSQEFSSGSRGPSGHSQEEDSGAAAGITRELLEFNRSTSALDEEHLFSPVHPPPRPKRDFKRSTSALDSPDHDLRRSDSQGSRDYAHSTSSLEDQVVPVTPPPRLKKQLRASQELAYSRSSLLSSEPDVAGPVTPPPRLKKQLRASQELTQSKSSLVESEPDSYAPVTPPPRQKRKRSGSNASSVASSVFVKRGPEQRLLEEEEEVVGPPEPEVLRFNVHSSSAFQQYRPSKLEYTSTGEGLCSPPPRPPKQEGPPQRPLKQVEREVPKQDVPLPPTRPVKQISLVKGPPKQEQLQRPTHNLTPQPPPIPKKRSKMTLGSKPPSGDEKGNPNAPIFVREMSDVVVKVGTRGRLLVEVDPNFGSAVGGAAGGGEQENLKITWYRNDQRITIPQDPTTSRIRQTSEGRFHYLDISPVTTDDEGKWICTAENFGGRSSCSSQVKVMVPKSYRAPEFVEGLRAVLTEAGTVSLECKVIGTPTPLLKWYKDGVEIKAGDIFALRGDPSSLGVYTCEATNCMGSITSSSRVHMNDASSPTPSRLQITHPLQDTRIRVGERAELTLACNSDIPENASVTWYNKSTIIPSSDRVIPRTEKNACSLYLNPVEIMDDGEWVCEIGVGKDMKLVNTCTMSLLVPRNYRKPKFLEDLKAILTEEGLVSFECKVCGFPTPILHWFKDGYELKPGDVYQLSGANSLGRYSCIAHNCMGDAESSTELTLEDIQHQLSDDERKALIAEGVGSKRPPKFITGLKSIEQKIGEPCELFVEINDPKCTVQWVRDGSVIEVDGDKYSVRRDGGVCSLVIRELEFEDQAEWKCNGTNEYGVSVSCASVRLVIPGGYKKPKFLESLRAVLSEEGTVNLECKVIGVPVPLLKWYKDGVELKAGDIHRIISGADGTCCLGTYTCVAKNCMGEVSSSAALLGFEDKVDKVDKSEKQQNNLTRDPSLSTIMEERTSQMLSVYETPNVPKSIEEEERGDVSVSIDGKDVSVSLYETPDLTENDARQIIEMFANEYSEYISEHNIVPLPSLRFVKETSTSGNIVMEAVVIDVTDDPFDTAKSASMGGVLREDPTENDYDDNEFSDYESPMDISGTSDLPADRSRPGSLREKRRHSGSLSRRSSEKKSRKDEVKCGMEVGGVSKEELEMFGERDTSVYLSAESERSGGEEEERRVSAVEEFERMIGEGLMMGVGGEVGFEGVETLKYSDRGFSAFGGLEGGGLGVYEGYESLVGGEGVRGDVGVEVHEAAGGFSVGVFSNVGEMGREEMESLKNAEEVNVFGGERFVGIEMAEMVLEGADTFSDVDSLTGTVGVEKVESGSFGGVGVEEGGVVVGEGAVPTRPVRRGGGRKGDDGEEEDGVGGKRGRGEDVVEKPPRKGSKERGKGVEEGIDGGERVGVREEVMVQKGVVEVEGAPVQKPPRKSSRERGKSVEGETIQRGRVEEVQAQKVVAGDGAQVQKPGVEGEQAVPVQKPPRKSSKERGKGVEETLTRGKVEDVQQVGVGGDERGRVQSASVEGEGAPVKKPPRKGSRDRRSGEIQVVEGFEGEMRETEIEGPETGGQWERVEEKIESRGRSESVEVREVGGKGRGEGEEMKQVRVGEDEKKGTETREAKVKEDSKSKGEAGKDVKAEAERKAEEEQAEKEKAEKEEREREEREAWEKAKLKERKDAKERAEREAKEQAEREAKEQAEREAKEIEAKRKKEQDDKGEKEVREKNEREGEEKAEQDREDKEAKEKVETDAREKEKAEKNAKEKAEMEAKEKAEKEKQEKEAKAEEEKEREMKEKTEKEKAEKEAVAKKEREAKEKADVEKKEKDAAKEKEMKEKAEKEAREKSEKEAKEKAEKEKKEKADKEKKEQEMKEKSEKEAKEKAEKEVKEKAEKEAKEKAEKEKKEKEANEKKEQELKEKAEKEKKEKEAKEKTEKEAKEKAEKEKQVKAEKERVAKEKAEKEEKEKGEKEAKENELKEKEKAEKLKQEKEKKEKEAKEKADKEAKEKAEKEKLEKEKKEKEEKEKGGKDKVVDEKAEKEAAEKKEREAKEKAEKEKKEKDAKEKAEKEKKEQELKEKAEKEAKEKADKESKEKAEREAKEKAEKEKLEKEAKKKAEKEAAEKKEREAKEMEKKEKEAKEKAEKKNKEKEAKEKAEKEKKEKEVKEKAEKEKKEQEEKEKKEREAKEKADKEKKEKEAKEKEKMEKEKAEKDAKDKKEKEAKEKKEREEKEKLEKDKEAKEKKEQAEKEKQDKLEKEKKENEAKEKAEKEKKDKEAKEKQDKLEKEKKEKEAKEKADKEKVEKEAKEKADKEKAEKEKKEAMEKSEKEKKDKEAKEKAEKEANEKAEKEKKEAKEKAEKEKKEKEATDKSEKEAKEKAEKEKKEKETKEKVDKDKEAKEKSEKEKKEKEAKEKAEKEKLEQEKAAKEKSEKEKKEKADKEKVEKEKSEKEKLEKEAKEKSEKEKGAKEKLDKEKAAKEKSEKEKKEEKEKAEKEKLEKEKEAKEKKEKESKPKESPTPEKKDPEKSPQPPVQDSDSAPSNTSDPQDRIIKEKKEGGKEETPLPSLSKRPSLDDTFKIKTVKKVNKIELHSLILEGDKVQSEASPPVESSGKRIGGSGPGSPTGVKKESGPSSPTVKKDSGPTSPTGVKKESLPTSPTGVKKESGKGDVKVEEVTVVGKKVAEKVVEGKDESKRESVKKEQEKKSGKEEEVAKREPEKVARKGSVQDGGKEQESVSRKSSAQDGGKGDESVSRKGSVKDGVKKGSVKEEQVGKKEVQEKPTQEKLAGEKKLEDKSPDTPQQPTSPTTKTQGAKPSPKSSTKTKKKVSVEEKEEKEDSKSEQGEEKEPVTPPRKSSSRDIKSPEGDKRKGSVDKTSTDDSESRGKKKGVVGGEVASEEVLTPVKVVEGGVGSSLVSETGGEKESSDRRVTREVSEVTDKRAARDVSEVADKRVTREVSDVADKRLTRDVSEATDKLVSRDVSETTDKRVTREISRDADYKTTHEASTKFSDTDYKKRDHTDYSSDYKRSVGVDYSKHTDRKLDYDTTRQPRDYTPTRYESPSRTPHHHHTRYDTSPDTRLTSTLPRAGTHLFDNTRNITHEHVYNKRSHELAPRLTERAKSYDHLPGYYYGQDTFSGESRGVVTCGGMSGMKLLSPGFSSGVHRSQNLIERTRDTSSPAPSRSTANIHSLEDLTLIEQTRSFSRELRQEKVKAMTRKWKTDDEHGDSLAEMDELPTHEYVSPPAAPPRRRRNNYQVKVSSEAEDIYGSTTLKGDLSGGLYSMPSYFTTPSVGYSYFSMASLNTPPASTSGSFLALDEAHRLKRPRFSMKLQNRTTPENTDIVKFACTVFGTPEPTIQWYKNGLPIFSDRQKYVITSSCGVCTLDIRDIEKGDTGEYTCFARNFYGKAASSSILQVVGVESSTTRSIIPDTRSSGGVSGEKCVPVCFSTGIIETTFPEVNELVLECQVKGSPKPEVMWTKNGSEIISYGQTTYGRFRADYANIFETGKCRLIIQRPRESDSGVYTCVGRNYDYSAVGRRLCWTDEITKCVNVKSGGNTSPKGGLYTTLSTHTSSTSSFEYQAPRFVTELEPSKRVRVGGDIALTVEITGVPQPEVRWFHHKNTIYPIKPSSHVRVITEAPGVHTLFIPEVDPFDFGTYTVRVTNKYGMVESSCSIQEYIVGVTDSPTLSGIRAGRKPADNNVQPRFVREPKENYVLKYGDDLVVECEVEGWPQVSVNLYRGCRNVTLQPRAYKEMVPAVPVSSGCTSQVVKFTITNLHCTDFGMYTVEVKNIVGSVKAFVNVKLYDPHTARSARSMTPALTCGGLSPASSTTSTTHLFHRSTSPYYLQSTSNLSTTYPRPYLPNPNPRSTSTRSLLHQTTSSTFGLHLRGSSPSLRRLSCSSHFLSREY